MDRVLTVRNIRMIVIHHSATDRGVTTEQIRRHHIDANGWADIGYHWVIEGDGRVHPGRPEERTGAHAVGHNLRSVGVCVVGDNTVEGREWTPAQRDSLWALVAGLRTRWPEAEVVGHRDLTGAHTLCPGLDVKELRL